MCFIGLAAGCDDAARIIPLKDSGEKERESGRARGVRGGGPPKNFLLFQKFVSSIKLLRTAPLHLLTPFLVINVPSDPGRAPALILMMYH